MTDPVKLLSDDEVAEIAEMFPHAEYQPTIPANFIDLCEYCKGTIDDHKANCVVPHVHALCATVRALRAERTGILSNMTEMNQARALDRNAWRRVGETLGLTEEESAHTSHVLAVLEGRAVRYTALRDQLAQSQAGYQRATIGLSNLYHVITNEHCDDAVALGMATSAVSSLIREHDELRSQLAQVTQELNELRICDTCERPATNRTCQLHRR